MTMWRDQVATGSSIDEGDKTRKPIAAIAWRMPEQPSHVIEAMRSGICLRVLFRHYGEGRNRCLFVSVHIKACGSDEDTRTHGTADMRPEKASTKQAMEGLWQARMNTSREWSQLGLYIQFNIICIMRSLVEGINQDG